MIGDKVALKSDPLNVLPDNHKMGSYEFSGDRIKLQSEPSSVKYGANTPNGEFQHSGDKIKLQSKAYSGFQNHKTPMSSRAVAQKQNY
jgi:hypothetical protein